VAEEMVRGGRRHLEELLSEHDVREALTITKTLDKKTKSAFRPKAKAKDTTTLKTLLPLAQ
jgi:hypothetical protein